MKIWSPWRMEVYVQSLRSISDESWSRSMCDNSYPTTGAGDPTPVVEPATKVRDLVGGVLGVSRLHQMVIVFLLDFLGHGDRSFERL